MNDNDATIVLIDVVQEHMRTYFGYLADHGMVDSPDGPRATEMRNLGKANVLTPEQVRKVAARCAGECLVQAKRIEEYERLTRQLRLLVGLACFSGDQEKIQRTERECEKFRQDLQFPQFLESALFLSRTVGFCSQMQGSSSQFVSP